MSCLLALLNRLKAEVNITMLTDSQMHAYKTIIDNWRFPQRVNLHGPPGSGCTFLAWAISRSQGVPFYPGPEALRDINEFESRVIIDNVPSTERAIRDLLAKLQLHEVHSALVITHRPVGLGFTGVDLPSPTTDDFDVVYHNLSVLDYYAIEPVRHGGLWAAMHAVCS